MNVARAQMPEAEPNTIAFVQKTGYNIKDQVLRPCWVGVVAEQENLFTRNIVDH